MAAPITHIVVANKLLDTVLKIHRKKDFIMGTVFPDIRYLKVIEREKTHPKNLPNIDSLPRGSFLAGVYFHSLVDHAREDFMVKNSVYSLCLGAEYATTSLKWVEDEILYQKIKDPKKIVRYFDTILSQEIAFGVKKEVIRKWHIILQPYLSHTPNKESRRNVMLALHFPLEKIGTIEVSVQKMRENKKVIEVIEKFYRDLDTLFK